MRSPLMQLLAFWGYGSLGLIAAGNFVTRMTFLHMAWKVDVPSAPGKKLGSRLWISGPQAKQVLQSYCALDPGSRLYRLNKLGGVSEVIGLVSTVAWVVTMCFLIVSWKG